MSVAKRVAWATATVLAVAACGRVELAGLGGEAGASDAGEEPSLSPGAGGKAPKPGRGGAGGRPTVVRPEGGEPGDDEPPSGGTGGATTMGGTGGSACPSGQHPIQGVCQCPAYAPDYCEAEGVCTKLADDPSHCGACDTQCSATQACSESECQPIPVQTEVTVNCGSLRLVRDGAMLYILTADGHLFYFDPIEAFHAVELARDLGSTTTAFAVEGAFAYVVSGNTVKRTGIDVEGTETITTEALPIHDLALAGGLVYYATGKEVRSVPMDATDALGVTVATALDEGEPQGVSVSANHIFYASTASFNVESQLLGGSEHHKLGASQGSLLFGHDSIQSHGQRVFWSNADIRSVSLADPELFPKTVAVSRHAGTITAFAATGTNTYFATDLGEIEKATPDDEVAKPIARGIFGVDSMVAGPEGVDIAAGCSIFHLDP